MKKAGLYLMGYKGLVCLQAIVDSNNSHLIALVIGSKDEAIQNDYYDEIAAYCSNNNIPFKNRKEIIEINFDVAVAISWRWLIKFTDDIPLIVFHDSLLPKYRGFAPLVNSLVNAESKIGVTALFASEEYDKGNIIMQKGMDVSYPIKIEMAIESVSKCYAELITTLFEMIETGNEIDSNPQDENEASYSLWLDENDYQIKWNQPAVDIKRFIDSVGYPYLGACTFIKDQKVRIFDAEVCEDVKIENRIPGKLIFLKDNCPVVVCGKGLLKLVKVENESGQSMLPLKNFRTQFL